MGVRDDQDVPSGIRKGVQTQETRSPSNQQMRRLFGLFHLHPSGDSVVYRGDHIAENTVAIHASRPWPVPERLGNPWAGSVAGAAHVVRSPRCPQTFHSPEYRTNAEPANPSGISQRHLLGLEVPKIIRLTP